MVGSIGFRVGVPAQCDGGLEGEADDGEIDADVEEERCAELELPEDGNLPRRPPDGCHEGVPEKQGGSGQPMATMMR
jgi:hypothetical protein